MSDTIQVPHRHTAPALRRSSDSSRVPVRLTARGRLLLVVVTAVLALAVVGFLTGRSSGNASDSPQPAAQRTIVVQPGQTLWSIAKQVAPGRDVRETVYEIRKLNGLSDAVITSGQTLVLPAG